MSNTQKLILSVVVAAIGASALLALIFEYLSEVTFKPEPHQLEVSQKSMEQNKVCLDGQLFYVGVHYLTQKLDDNGKPVKCEVK